LTTFFDDLLTSINALRRGEPIQYVPIASTPGIEVSGARMSPHWKWGNPEAALNLFNRGQWNIEAALEAEQSAPAKYLNMEITSVDRHFDHGLSLLSALMSEG
jgi:hypothetical protein